MIDFNQDMRQTKESIDLNNQIGECLEILLNMETALLEYQHQLDNVNKEIGAIQTKSKDLNLQMSTRMVNAANKEFRETASGVSRQYCGYP